MILENDSRPLYMIVEPPLGWVVINRPGARNALTTDMWRELAGMVQVLSADEGVRIIILRGAGDKSFISGADLADLQQQLQQPGRGEASYRFTVALCETITNVPLPVIAMINGHCLGGGVLIALMCDLRLASEQARFAIPAVNLGVAYPPEHGVTRLVHTVGATMAADLLLTGRTLTAAEALQFGLVNRLARQDELLATTRDFALALARGAPLTMAAHKLAMQQAISAKRDVTVLEEAASRCYHSADCQEGLRAFLTKRAPHFTGQ